jgi:uncharacterized protein
MDLRSKMILSNGAAHRAALFLFATIAFAAGGVASLDAKMAREKLWLMTSAGEQPIEVEIAQTPDEMAMGLMMRTNLPEGEGMLFPSPAPREAQMWMRNTYIPLDMVFIRADGVVHRIEAMTEPFSETIIPSQGDVLAVLELAGGAAGRMGLKAGDKVRHRLFAKGP